MERWETEYVTSASQATASRTLLVPEKGLLRSPGGVSGVLCRGSGETNAEAASFQFEDIMPQEQPTDTPSEGRVAVRQGLPSAVSIVIAVCFKWNLWRIMYFFFALAAWQCKPLHCGCKGEDY
jgi:hypothetical protein